MYLVFRLHSPSFSTLSLHDVSSDLSLLSFGDAASPRHGDRRAAFCRRDCGRADPLDRGAIHLDLHRALPLDRPARLRAAADSSPGGALDRKSTRLNSSHRCISYSVFTALHSLPFPYTTSLPILACYRSAMLQVRAMAIAALRFVGAIAVGLILLIAAQFTLIFTGLFRWTGLLVFALPLILLLAGR